MARYRNVHCLIWFDEKFTTLSDDAKLIWFFLLTNPRGTMLGIAVQGQSDMAEFLGWTTKRFAEPFAELLRERLIAYDERTRTLYLRNFLKYNPIENENQAKSAAKLLEEIPETSPFIQEVKRFLEPLSKPFLKPLLERLGERYGEPAAVAVSSSSKQYQKKSRTTPSAKIARDGTGEDFEQFWSLYPRKTGKGAARKAWEKVSQNGLPAWPILEASLRAHLESTQWEKDDGQYIPHPDTWLNQERWHDTPQRRWRPSDDDTDRGRISGALETTGRDVPDEADAGP